MGLLGGLLVFLAIPLVIAYFISGSKKGSWLKLALLPTVIGVLIILLPD